MTAGLGGSPALLRADDPAKLRSVVLLGVCVSARSGPVGSPPLRLHGDLDLVSVPDLERLLGDLVTRGTDRLVVDLTDVSFCDVAGLNTLLRADRELRAAGGRLVLVRPCPSLALMLEALGLSERVTVEPAARPRREDVSDIR
jgi:anti-sigma B factor antagonist